MKTKNRRSMFVGGVMPSDRVMALLENAPAGLTVDGIAVTINRDVPGTRRVLGVLRARNLAEPNDDGRWQLTEHARELAKERRSA